jgi:hypothetical protein
MSARKVYLLEIYLQKSQHGHEFTRKIDHCRAHDISTMILSQAPVWGSFTFTYKGIDIYVPNFLNNVARYKPISFWDWLIYIKNPRQTSVALVYENIGEEEQYSKAKN